MANISAAKNQHVGVIIVSKALLSFMSLNHTMKHPVETYKQGQTLRKDKGQQIRHTFTEPYNLEAPVTVTKCSQHS